MWILGVFAAVVSIIFHKKNEENLGEEKEDQKTQKTGVKNL